MILRFSYLCSANDTEAYNLQAVILVSLVLKFHHLRHQWNLVVDSCLCPNQEEIQSDSLSANNCQLLPTAARTGNDDFVSPGSN